MSFLAECTFCSTKVKVPDGADGLSVPCPRCGNSFTLAAIERKKPVFTGVTKAPAPNKVEPPLAAMNGPQAPSVLSPKEKLSGSAAPVPEEYIKQALGADQLQKALSQPKRNDPAQAHPPFWQIEPVGACSFFFGCIALVFAQIAFLSFLAIPLGCVGLLLGLVGILLCLDTPRRGWILAAGGTTVSAAVIGIVLLVPGLFGIEPRTEGEESERTDPVVEKVDARRIEGRDADEAEWVDAGKHLFRVGKMRIKVAAVQIKRLQYKDGTVQPVKEGKSLAITLRLSNINNASAIAYRSWQAPGAAGLRLKDNTGKTYAAASLEPGKQVAGHVNEAKVSLGQPVTDVLVFRVPVASYKYLRLELPAAAVGGTGTLRLHIPRSMVVEQ
jgi:hypothetical protein